MTKEQQSQKNHSPIQDFNPPKRELPEMVIPFLEELLLALGKNQGYMLLITDENGIILEVYGDKEAIRKAHSLNLKAGISMKSSNSGANAIGKALKEEQAVQIGGQAHHLEAFQRLTSSAAPIIDANNNILGTICLVSDPEKFHPHTFSLVSTTAKAIENKFHNTHIQQQLYDAQQYSFSIMNELSFGLIAVDQNGIIHWVNDTACRSLNIRRLKLVKKSVQSIFPEWFHTKEQIDQGEKLLDYEATFNIKNNTEKYLINAYSIQNEFKENIGYVITFRSLSRMLKLINKYSGSQLNFTFDKIIFKSKIIKKLVEYGQTVANTPSTILITGESGTGKEVFAQAIHNASDRRNGSFVAINCGAISAGLIESELFGYEGGAFTGAQKGGKAGKIETAHQGSLFLDEIGEMPMDMQVKLLRTLQEKTLTRVGGNKEIKVDIRVIAATNKNLHKEVAEGNFRQDLYYRLSVIPLHLPSLRERKMDIPPLFRYFLTNKADKLNRPIPAIDPNTMRHLVNYSWPGNVRELENFAEKAVILEGKIGDMFLPGGSEEKQEDKTDILSFKNKDQLPGMDEIEKQAILQYMEIFEHNISKTAKALGMGRNTLYKKMEKYGI